VPIKIRVRLNSGRIQEATIGGSVATIGRAARCDFTVLEESISRRHCKVELRGGEFYITDLNSGNGVYIDGSKIEPGIPVHFNTFLQLSLGSLDFQIADEASGYTQAPLVANVRPAPVTPAPKETQTPPPEKAERQLALNALLKEKTSPPSKRPRLKKLLIAAGLLFAVVIILPNLTSSLLSGLLTPKSFLALSEYQRLQKEKNCRNTNGAICQDLGLTIEEGEGVIAYKNMLIIYMYAGRQGREELFQKISYKEDRQAVASIYSFISTNTYKQRKGRMHLVLFNDEDVVFRIYNFSQVPPALMQSVMEALPTALSEIQAGKTDKFFQLMGLIMQSKEL
jgi:hypothetical protein